MILPFSTYSNKDLFVFNSYHSESQGFHPSDLSLNLAKLHPSSFAPCPYLLPFVPLLHQVQGA